MTTGWILLLWVTFHIYADPLYFLGTTFDVSSFQNTNRYLQIMLAYYYVQLKLLLWARKADVIGISSEDNLGRKGKLPCSFDIDLDFLLFGLLVVISK